MLLQTPNTLKSNPSQIHMLRTSYCCYYHQLAKPQTPPHRQANNIIPQLQAPHQPSLSTSPNHHNHHHSPHNHSLPQTPQPCPTNASNKAKSRSTGRSSPPSPQAARTSPAHKRRPSSRTRNCAMSSSSASGISRMWITMAIWTLRSFVWP